MEGEAIWKFPLLVTDKQLVEIPLEAKLLYVDVQYETPSLWALVNTGAKKRAREIYTVGTGHDCGFIPDNAKYVGTYMLVGGSFVGHVFG